jgi:hypothetical protein
MVAGFLALGLVLSSQQQASAWSKWSFNAGISVNYEGGNNSALWGMFRSGQVPGYPTDVWQGFCAPQFGYPGYGGFGGYGGYGGYAVPYDHAAAPSGQQTQPATGPGTTQPQQNNKGETQAVYYNNYNRQPTGNYYPTNNYQYSNYGYSGYGYGNYQVPSYWYGN